MYASRPPKLGFNCRNRSSVDIAQDPGFSRSPHCYHYLILEPVNDTYGSRTKNHRVEPVEEFSGGIVAQSSNHDDLLQWAGTTPAPQRLFSRGLSAFACAHCSVSFNTTPLYNTSTQQATLIPAWRLAPIGAAFVCPPKTSTGQPIGAPTSPMVVAVGMLCLPTPAPSLWPRSHHSGGTLSLFIQWGYNTGSTHGN